MSVSESVVLSYIGTAMWSSHVMLPETEENLVDGCMDVPEGHHLHGVSEQDNLDDHYDWEDLTDEAYESMKSDVNRFFDSLEIQGLLEDANEHNNDEHIAHDFWLTRNGHGAGFWDGDYEEELGEKLTELAKAYGECNLCVNCDGQVEIL